MASYSKRFPQNCNGNFYVDSQCIDCDLCRQMAPNFFKRHFVGNAGHSYVAQQPTSDNDINLCSDAMDACPVSAIGCLQKIPVAA